MGKVFQIAASKKKEKEKDNELSRVGARWIGLFPSPH